MNDEPAPPAEEEPSTAAKPLADTVTAIAGAITAAAALVVGPGESRWRYASPPLAGVPLGSIRPDP